MAAVSAPASNLPARALLVFEAEVSRLREQQSDLRRKIAQFDDERHPDLGFGMSLASTAMPSDLSRTAMNSTDFQTANSPSSCGGGNGGSPSRGNSGVAKLANDLRNALAQANQKRQQACENLAAFEDDAAAEEGEVLAELYSAMDVLRSLRARLQQQAVRGWRSPEHASSSSGGEGESVSSRRRLAAAGRSFFPPSRRHMDDAETCMQLQMLEDLCVEKDLAVVEGNRLLDELLRSRDRFDEEIRRPQSPGVLADALEGTGIDALAVDTVGVDAVESMLRAESTAMRTALRFYGDEYREAAMAKANEVEERSFMLQAQAVKEEYQATEAGEQRLRIGEACVADAMSRFVEPRGDALRDMQDAVEDVERRQAACRELEVSTEPMEALINRLRGLRSAAEVKAVQLGRLLSPLITSRTSVQGAVAEVKKTRLKGAGALVMVLAQLCGSPRIAFLALDGNRNGRISMCEFDNGLRLRLSLDYEAITRMRLTALFREFDQHKRGILQEQDFANCCPLTWQEYGES
eukprot:TRINITY_DN63664_c0_g1_i1.p1 TRINITY_DN63664_c0_g1~~TRINITY_DN63664_c0_g1_i1.p1  ORF type:complete len:522 (-),score=92.86 TRINITY_DN63664_c0_g1_i1:236-1801(-)